MVASIPAYLPVFQMAVFHEYFAGGAYPHFNMLPSGQTEKILSRFGLIGAQAENCFTIYAETARKEVFSRPELEAAFCSQDLIYSMRFRDSSFTLYTQLPQSEGCLPCYTNHSATLGRHRLRLSAERVASAKDLATIQPGSFSVPLRKPDNASAPFWLVAANGQRMMQLPQPLAGSLHVDPRHLPEGRYFVIQGSRKICNFFYNAGVFLFPASAMLSISSILMLDRLKSLSAAKSFHKVSSESALPLHTLSFQARCTVWRYDIFNHGGANAREFKVVPGTSAAKPRPRKRAQAGVSFALVPGVQSPGGEVSIAFESSSRQLIPLQARSQHRFQLLRQGRVVIDALPSPDLAFGRSARGKALCSAMFVYL